MLGKKFDKRINSVLNHDKIWMVLVWQILSTFLLSYIPTIQYLFYSCVYTGSLKFISKVAAHVSESICQVDNFKKLLGVQKKLVGIGDSLVSPNRVSNKVVKS